MADEFVRRPGPRFPTGMRRLDDTKVNGESVPSMADLPTSPSTFPHEGAAQSRASTSESTIAPTNCFADIVAPPGATRATPYAGEHRLSPETFGATNNFAPSGRLSSLPHAPDQAPYGPSGSSSCPESHADSREDLPSAALAESSTLRVTPSFTSPRIHRFPPSPRVWRSTRSGRCACTERALNACRLSVPMQADPSASALGMCWYAKLKALRPSAGGQMKRTRDSEEAKRPDNPAAGSQCVDHVERPCDLKKAWGRYASLVHGPRWLL